MHRKDKIAFRMFDRNYSRLLPSDKNALIIDLGCGDGKLLRWLSSLGYHNIIGYDIDPIAIQKVTSCGISAYLLDIEYVVKANSDVDMIFLRRVIEHIPVNNIPEFISNIEKSLSSNGVLVVETPNAEAILASGSRYSDLQHSIMFSKNTLKDLLSKSFKKGKVIPLREVGFKYEIMRPLASLLLRPIIWSFGLSGYWYEYNFIIAIAKKEIVK